VLLALSALLLCGLLRHSAKYFRLPRGFYGLTPIFLLLAFMALGRLRSVEALRYYAPGEWGKLLGLDRAPEVRTLRIKLKHLADQEQAFSWSSTLCQEWMLEAPEEAAVLYVDGHVRVYHGTAKSLPKHYVARERLCLSATADYWGQRHGRQALLRGEPGRRSGTLASAQARSRAAARTGCAQPAKRRGAF
jgi:hypothetical protein